MSVSRDVRASIFEAIRLKAVAHNVLLDITTYIQNGNVADFLHDNKNLPLFIDVSNYTQPYHIEDESANFILIEPFSSEPSQYNYYGTIYDPIIDRQGNVTGFTSVQSTGNRDLTYRISIHATSREAYDKSIEIVGQALPYHYYLPIINAETEQYTKHSLHIKFVDQIYKEERSFEETHFNVALLYKVMDVPFDSGVTSNVTYSTLQQIRYSITPKS